MFLTDHFKEYSLHYYWLLHLDSVYLPVSVLPYKMLKIKKHLPKT